MELGSDEGRVSPTHTTVVAYCTHLIRKLGFLFAQKQLRQ